MQFLSRLKYLFPDDVERIQALFPVHGHHARLLMDRRGNCFFLGQMGCLFPQKDWLFFRLFPSWVIDGRVAFFTSDIRQAQKGSRSVNKAMKRLEMNTPRILTLYKALRRAWMLEG
jgi:hypothetical protein